MIIDLLDAGVLFKIWFEYPIFYLLIGSIIQKICAKLLHICFQLFN